MKKKLVYVLFACLAMVNMALGQQKESRLTLNPEVPVAGQSLELLYDAEREKIVLVEQFRVGVYLTGEYRQPFMLHYNFPPFSVGETKRSHRPALCNIQRTHPECFLLH